MTILHSDDSNRNSVFPPCYSRPTAAAAAAMSFYTRVYLRDHFKNSINHRNLLAPYPSVNQIRSHVGASRDLLQKLLFITYVPVQMRVYSKFKREKVQNVKYTTSLCPQGIEEQKTATIVLSRMYVIFASDNSFRNFESEYYVSILYY